MDTERKTNLVDECRALKKALQDLFDLYGDSVLKILFFFIDVAMLEKKSFLKVF